MLAVAFTPGGAISGGDDHRVRVWDLESGREVRALAQPAGSVRAVVASRDGRFALSGSEGKGPGTLLRWSLALGSSTPLAGHTGDVMSIALSPDGRRAVSGGDGDAFVWPLLREARTATIPGRERKTLAVALAPDGAVVLAASQDGLIRLFDAHAAEVDRIDLAPCGDYATSLAIAADGRSFVAGTARGVVLRFALHREP